MNVFEERQLKALALIERYAGIDGGHHKQWLLDQVVRLLTAHHYDLWVARYEGDEPGSWDTGTPP